MKKQRGISLIVLVITIIVMIILAGSIILTLSNNGIINQASDAVEESDLVTIKTEAELKQAEYILDSSVAAGDDLETWLNKVVKHDGYYIKLYNKQPYVIKEGTLVDKYYKGEINIGDYVGYNAGENEIKLNQYVGENYKNNMTAEQVTISSTSNMKWRVLGAEGDKIKLISEEVVNPDDKDAFSLYGAYSYLKGVEVLHNACSVFGKGKYAISARSITADDVNEITGFDKTQSVGIMFGTVWMKNDIPYGLKLNYNGEEKKFYGISCLFPILKHPDITAGENNEYVKEQKMEVEGTAYSYAVSTLMEETLSNPSKFSEKYKLLFRNPQNTGNVSYVLATTMAHINERYINYGLAYVSSDAGGVVNNYELRTAGDNGEYYKEENGDWVVAGECKDVDYVLQTSLRPVVILEGNILVDKVDNTWNFR